jgi:hypothetical protein
VDEFFSHLPMDGCRIYVNLVVIHPSKNIAYTYDKILTLFPSLLYNHITLESFIGYLIPFFCFFLLNHSIYVTGIIEMSMLMKEMMYNYIYGCNYKQYKAFNNQLLPLYLSQATI